MQTKSPLFEVLTGEINHRSIAGLLIVVVLLLHLWLVIFLMQPSNDDKKVVPLKVMEVVLLPEPKKIEVPQPEPLPKKTEPAKPAPKRPVPPKPAPKKEPPKKVEPKKQEIKAPVKTKAPPIDKTGEIVKPTAVAKELVPNIPAPVNPVVKNIVPKVAVPRSSPISTPPAKTDSGAGGNSPVKLLARAQLDYPMRAKSRGIEGSVKIELTVSASGAVTNPRVIDASPPGIFDGAALDAVRKFRFKPKMVNGTPVAERATQVITFTLSK